MESVSIQHQKKEKGIGIKPKTVAGGFARQKSAINQRGSIGSDWDKDRSSPGGILQRTCSCGNHTIAGGNCSKCRQNRESAFQSAASNNGNLKTFAQTARDSAFDQDFSRIPAQATSLLRGQPGEQAEYGEQTRDTATAGADKTEIPAPEPLVHDFGTWRIHPISAFVARRASALDVPSSGTAPDDDFIDQPLRGSGASRSTAPRESESPGLPGNMPNLAGIIRPFVQMEDGDCEQPISMDKVTSGAFIGGMTMDSYYPDLAGAGYYSHPGTGGTFDTGSRVGANVQLYGVIPSTCEPGNFTLEQTVSRTRYRHNGVTHAREGEFADDIAKSGRDGSTAPFRQEFLGGDGAPPGYIISMADPPSTGYAGNIDIEHDREFVTSLVGPGGRRSVNWSLSTRVEDGAVTENTLT